VLNTHFLNIILKLLRQGLVNYTVPSRTTSSPANAQALTQQVMTLQHQSKYICATVLALMLRYATFIQPPTVRNRDDHIVQVLVSMLRENFSSSSSGSVSSTSRSGSGGDSRLRKRLVAALGEIVFYISSQDDDNAVINSSGVADGADGGPLDKWVLPQGAVDMLARSLKDDNDEVIRHYAAKVSWPC
jgi:serine/threonine-protein kinase ULK4